MLDFTFYTPTRLIFGKDKYKEVGFIISSYGYKNIALVIGQGSIKNNGVLDSIITSLNDNNISFTLLSGVNPNPCLSKVLEFKNELKNNKVEMILACGGGSVLDASKLLAHLLCNDVEPFAYNSGAIKPTKALPVGTILTIAGSGSEMSSSCVISNDLVSPSIKKGFNSDTNRPLFSILDPTLTFTVSKYQTACGIVDTMMHTLERYFTCDDNSELIDSFSLDLLANCIKYGRLAYNNPNDYEARAQLMICSTLSHNDLMSIGKKTMLRIHQYEHILSGVYPSIAHGAGLAILWPAYQKLLLKNNAAIDKMKKLYEKLFNTISIEDGINKLIMFFDELGMPTSFKDLDEDVDISLLMSEHDKLSKVIPGSYLIMDSNFAKELFTLCMED